MAKRLHPLLRVVKVMDEALPVEQLEEEKKMVPVCGLKFESDWERRRFFAYQEIRIILMPCPPPMSNANGHRLLKQSLTWQARFERLLEKMLAFEEGYHGWLKESFEEYGAKKKDKTAPSSSKGVVPDCPVELLEIGLKINARVFGKEKSLSPLEYHAVKLLIDAFPKGLTSKELSDKSKNSPPSRFLQGLKDKDEDFGKALRSPSHKDTPASPASGTWSIAPLPSPIS